MTKASDIEGGTRARHRDRSSSEQWDIAIMWLAESETVQVNSRGVCKEK